MSYDIVAFEPVDVEAMEADYLQQLALATLTEQGPSTIDVEFTGDHFLAAIQPEAMHLRRGSEDNTSRSEKENTVDSMDLLNLQPADLVADGDIWSHTVLDDLLTQKDFNLDDFIQFNATEKSVSRRVGRRRGSGRKAGASKDVATKVRQRRPKLVRMTTNPDGVTVFNCPECATGYIDKELLERHLSVHKFDRRFICEVCGVAMKRKEHIERHKLGHNDERPFSCNVCHKSFKRKEHHDIHYVIHSGEKTIICPECGKGFYRRDHLTTHLKSHVRRKLRKQRREEKLKEKKIALKPLRNVRRRSKCDFVIHVLAGAAADAAEPPIKVEVPDLPPAVESPCTAAAATAVVLPPFNEISSRIRLKRSHEAEIPHPSY